MHGNSLDHLRAVPGAVGVDMRGSAYGDDTQCDHGYGEQDPIGQLKLRISIAAHRLCVQSREKILRYRLGISKMFVDFGNVSVFFLAKKEDLILQPAQEFPAEGSWAAQMLLHLLQILLCFLAHTQPPAYIQWVHCLQIRFECLPGPGRIPPSIL